MMKRSIRCLRNVLLFEIVYPPEECRTGSASVNAEVSAFRPKNIKYEYLANFEYARTLPAMCFDTVHLNHVLRIALMNTFHIEIRRTSPCRQGSRADRSLIFRWAVHIVGRGRSLIVDRWGPSGINQDDEISELKEDS